MKNVSQMVDQVTRRVRRLNRWRLCAEVTTRVGCYGGAVVFVFLLMQGLGIIPLEVMGGVAALAVAAFLGAGSLALLKTAPPRLLFNRLSQIDPLGDAALSAWELDRALKEEQDPLVAGFIQAHILQTHRHLQATPATRVLPEKLLSRLQVMVVLCVCVLSAALL